LLHRSKKAPRLCAHAPNPTMHSTNDEPNTAERSSLKLHDGSGFLLKPHSRTARYCTEETLYILVGL
jgi:hypothetical protein